MRDEESEDDDRPLFVVYDDKSELRRAVTRQERSEDSESNDED
jgi:hypothetical protein